MTIVLPPNIPRAKLERIGSLINEIKRREERDGLEENLADFIKGGWRYIDPAPYVPNWHIEAICEHLQAVTDGEIKRLLITIPPRCMKSSLVSVCWPAWTWAQKWEGPLQGPDVQFLFASYAQSLSLRDSLKTRRLIESPWYQKYWGNRFKLTGDQNTKIRFENDKGGYRLATSVGGSLTGEGGQICVIDDAHNAIEIESDAVRESTIQWFDEALSTRLNDPHNGAFVIIMQRLGEGDLAGHVLDQDAGYVHLSLPMEHEPKLHCSTSIGWDDPRTEQDELLWPERFNREDVERLKRALGPFASAGQLQQQPVPRGGGIIKSDWWRLWPPQGEAFDKDGKPKNALEFPPMGYILMAVDTALTTKEENDWSAATVWGVFRDLDTGNPAVMLMDAWQERLEFRPLVDKIIATAGGGKGRAPVDMILIEGKANGQSVAQEIGRLCRKGQFGVKLDNPEGDKVARAYSIQHLFSSGMVFAPNRKYADIVIRESSSFPKGKHDDLTDTLTAALRFLRTRNILQFGDEYREDLAARLGPTGKSEPVYPT